MAAKVSAAVMKALGRGTPGCFRLVPAGPGRVRSASDPVESLGKGIAQAKLDNLLACLCYRHITP
jgi:hypothetical protein